MGRRRKGPWTNEAQGQKRGTKITVFFQLTRSPGESGSFLLFCGAYPWLNVKRIIFHRCNLALIFYINHVSALAGKKRSEKCVTVIKGFINPLTAKKKRKRVFHFYFIFCGLHTHG